MEDVEIALLGLGRAGSFHLESLRALPGVRLRWVHDADAAKADAAERSFREGAPVRIDAPAPAANAHSPGAPPA